MTNQLPDEHAVYRALFGIFTGANSSIRKPKAIRRLIEQHGNDEAISTLLQAHSLDDLCTVAKKFLDENLFDPNKMTATSRFFSARMEALEHQRRATTASDDLCGRCKRIDFAKIFATKPASRDGSLVAHLGKETAKWGLSSCPLCRLFAAVRTPHPHVDPLYSSGPPKDDSYCLWGFPACTLFDVYGALPIELPNIVDNVVFGVFLERDAAAGKLRDVISQNNPDFICDASDRDPGHLRAINGRVVDARRIDLGILREWLQYCQDEHDTTSLCRVRGSTDDIPLFKVIDCETRRVVDPPERCRFSALSYVWGVADDPPNVVDQGGSFRHGTLPAVVEDAIAVTTAAGLRYLWVDKYCIAQDDREVMHAQFRSMARVYSAAQFTVFATAGDDSAAGLPGIGSGRTREVTPPVIVGDLTLTRVSLTRDHFRTKITRSKWFERAWTYQEAIFSRRRVFFTDHGMYFECSGMWCSEHLNEAPPIRALRNAPNPSFPQAHVLLTESKLLDCIQDYSRRKLTFEEDKLNAFLGVLQCFEDLPDPIHHYQGVPILSSPRTTPGGEQAHRLGRRSCKDGFLHGLCWDINLPGTRRAGFPSWSWTGWQFSVQYSPNLLKQAEDVRSDASESDIGLWAELEGGWVVPWPSHAGFADILHVKTPSALSRFIHIDAWTVDLRFEDSGIAWGHRRDRPATLRDNDTHEPYFTLFPGTRSYPGLYGDYFWTVDVGPSAQNPAGGKAYVPLGLTRDVRECPGLAERLLGETWTGIILPPTGPDAAPHRITILVVDSDWDAAERVGIVELRASTARWRGRKAANPVTLAQRGGEADALAEVGAKVGTGANRELKMRWLDQSTGMTEEERQGGTGSWDDVLAAFARGVPRTRRRIRLG